MSTSSVQTTVGTRPPRVAGDTPTASTGQSRADQCQRGGRLAGHADVVAPGPAAFSSAASTSAFAVGLLRAPPHDLCARRAAPARSGRRSSTSTWSTRRARSGGQRRRRPRPPRASASPRSCRSRSAPAGRPRGRPRVVAEDHAVGVHAAQPAADVDHGDRRPLVDLDQHPVRPLPGDRRRRATARQRLDPALDRGEVDAGQRLARRAPRPPRGPRRPTSSLGAAAPRRPATARQRREEHQPDAADHESDQQEHARRACFQASQRRRPLAAGEAAPAAHRRRVRAGVRPGTSLQQARHRRAPRAGPGRAGRPR